MNFEHGLPKRRSRLPQDDPDQPRPAFSIVVPFFNESGNVRSLLQEIAKVVTELDGESELVLVDDGSSDDTADLLRSTAIDLGLKSSRVLSFAKNHGQAAALYFGLRAAKGETIITMDGDGQNSPADIFALLEALPQSDMAVGIRVARHDSWLRKKISRLANSVRSRVLGDGMTDSGCALKVFRREVIDAFLPIRTLYSFMPAFAVAAGFRVIEIPVAHRARTAGLSSYGLRVFLWRPILDMLGVWWFTRRRCGTRIALRDDPTERN